MMEGWINTIVILWLFLFRHLEEEDNPWVTSSLFFFSNWDISAWTIYMGNIHKHQKETRDISLLVYSTDWLQAFTFNLDHTCASCALPRCSFCIFFSWSCEVYGGGLGTWMVWVKGHGGLYMLNALVRVPTCWVGEITHNFLVWFGRIRRSQLLSLTDRMLQESGKDQPGISNWTQQLTNSLGHERY